MSVRIEERRKAEAKAHEVRDMQRERETHRKKVIVKCQVKKVRKTRIMCLADL